jgi:hypothetical protein
MTTRRINGINEDMPPKVADPGKKKNKMLLG